jgi:hypothetical protein
LGCALFAADVRWDVGIAGQLEHCPIRDLYLLAVAVVHGIESVSVAHLKRPWRQVNVAVGIPAVRQSNEDGVPV